MTDDIRKRHFLSDESVLSDERDDELTTADLARSPTN